MKLWISVLAVLVAISFTAVAEAKGKKNKGGGAGDTVRGTIASVSADKDKPQVVTLTVTGKGKKAQTSTVVTDEKTDVTINGIPGKPSELKEGQSLTATPAVGTATKIIATSGRDKAGKGKRNK